MPAISVIMSVLNGEQYLYKGVESIINQTFTDWEFIICDDGSTDRTYEMLLEYANKDDRIKIIKNDSNRGLAYSLNRCIEIARSNILARQDADDESDLHRFEVQYPYVMDHPEYAIVGTSFYTIDSNKNKKLFVMSEEPKAMDMLWVGKFMHPTWMMRKDLLEEVNYYTANKYTMRDQDYHLVMKILSKGMVLHNMEKPLYYYTNDDNTFNRTKNWKRVGGLMWIRFDSFRRNRLPFWTYVFVLKPLVKHLLPTSLTKAFYFRKRKYEKEDCNIHK